MFWWSPGIEYTNLGAMKRQYVSVMQPATSGRGHQRKGYLFTFRIPPALDAFVDLFTSICHIDIDFYDIRRLGDFFWNRLVEVFIT